jgi:hypothetical protein
MIAGISIIIDPVCSSPANTIPSLTFQHSAHLQDMRAIVESFMKMFPHDPKADDFSQKEALIVGLVPALKHRA